MSSAGRAALLVLACLAPAAHATIVEYELTALGGDRFRYDYEVTNDGTLGAGVAIENFAIVFDPTLYDEPTLAIVSTPPVTATWDEVLLGSIAPVIPPAYDAFALAGGIPDGASLAGFAIEFTWLGIGLPDTQRFEVFDPLTFALLEQGATRTTQAVPAPPTLVLALALGLVLRGARSSPPSSGRSRG